jgi:D-ribose pyranose/furanose isomerase RbsD
MGNKRAGWVTALVIAIAVSCVSCALGQEPADAAAGWQGKLHQILPLLGHRNWILIVDSAYPLQNSPGIETMETGAPLPDVLREVLEDVDHTVHVRPVVYLDAELSFVPEQDAPGVSRYRSELKTILGARPATRLPHEELLRKVDDVSRSYKVLILKTNETIPYTSVFLQLNCKYWSDQAEAALRAAMKRGAETSR